MNYKSTNIDKIKNFLDIQTVALDFGINVIKNFAKCIFHQDNNPSMSFFKGSRFMCFSCGAKGDVFSLVQKVRGCSFTEAIDILANKYSIEIDWTVYKSTDRSLTQNKEKFSSVLQELAFLFMKNLLSEDGKVAREYLISRGINIECMRKFNIGFSKNALSIQVIAKKKNYFNIFELLGCSKTAFENRIVIPIVDRSNRFIGFSCRKMPNSSSKNKYINTGSSQFFNKKAHFFAENYAYTEICKSNLAVLVEGQIDAIALHSVGIDVAIANQGTAFSTESVATLKKMDVKKVVIFFDGDCAGVDATSKICEKLLNCEIMPYVFPTPEYSDPMSLVQEGEIKSIKDIKSKCIRGDLFLTNKMDVATIIDKSLCEITYSSVDDIKQILEANVFEIKKLDFHKDVSEKSLKILNDYNLVKTNSAVTVSKQSKIDENILILVKIMTFVEKNKMTVNLLETKGIFNDQQGVFWDKSIELYLLRDHLYVGDIIKVMEDLLIDSASIEKFDNIDVIGNNFFGSGADSLMKLFSSIVYSMCIPLNGYKNLEYHGD